MPAVKEIRKCKFCGCPNLVFATFAGHGGTKIVAMGDADTGARHYCREYRQRQGKAPFNPTPSPEVTPEVQATEPEAVKEPSQAPSQAPNESAVLYGLVEPHVQAAIELALEDFKPVNTAVTHQIKVTYPDGAEKVLVSAHFQTARLIRLLSLRLNVMLVGPAGSGKTHAAHDAANALGLNFYPQSVGPQTSKSDLLGYMDANGRLVRTVLREAFEHGGVYLLDEMDAGNPGVLTILNALLANSVCSFPDGVIEKHKDFYVIAGANTYGHGANRQYVGRQQLDAATLDRFVGIEWQYDLNLEARLSGYAGNVPEQKEIFPIPVSSPDMHWLTFVWKLRDKASELGIRVVFGTRRIMQGSAMLAAGFTRAETEAATVWFGVSADDKAKLTSAIRN